MKPTFNLSAAYVAPNVPAAIVRTAAMATTFHFFMILLRVGQTGVSSQFPLEKPPNKPPRAKRPQRARRTVQRSGTKTTPSDAGAADPAVPRVLEINTRTTTV